MGPGDCRECRRQKSSCLDEQKHGLLDFDSLRVVSGGITLSWVGKTRHPVDRVLADQGRRDFLLRCSQAASLAFLPPSLSRFAFPRLIGAPSTQSGGNFHLHPHYRARLPLEALLLNTQAGSDRFITEKYAEQIEAIFAESSAGLKQSPRDVRALEKVFSDHFSGASLKPLTSHLLRENAGVEVRRNQFAEQATLGRDAFLHELRSALNAFTEMLVAEFQVTGIEASSLDKPTRLQTRVRYELVGAGQGFFREQRVGEWDLEWEAGESAASSFRVRSWRPLYETQSRSSAPVFVDIASQAFGGNPSYSAQILHGSDYWRTILDQACGIDIYGHNGVAVGDIDGDGFDDIYICQPAGLPNRLYRNRGDGTFEDITEISGLGILENTACALFADFGNRGHQDLVVVRTDGPVLYVNEGKGKFRKQANAFHFAQPPQGTFTGAAVADYDRDGYLDIYFCLYIYYQGADQYKYPLPYFDAENGPPNFLMRNNRDGTFRDVTAESGLNQNNTRYSFCCGWSDYNRDGWPDLYVVNDFGRKNLYRNNGDGTFTDVAAQTGVEDVGAGMSVCWLDYDNDGAEDLYVANMWTAAGQRITTQAAFQDRAPETARTLYRKHSMGNSLFRNPSAEKKTERIFQNAGSSAGVEMGRWSWSSDAWDFDHDGFPDLYVANGMVSGPSRADLNSFFWRQVVANSPGEAKPALDYEQGWNALNELIRADGTWSGYERNVFYANNRDGTFSDVSGPVGMDFVEDGRSFALADFDHDGRLEVVLKNRNAPQLRVLKNVIKVLPPSISFRLRGTRSNRDAIGAAITVECEASRQTRMLQAGSGFLSQHTKEVFFGMGAAKGPVRASVRWPSGLVQDLQNLPVDHRIWVEEGTAAPRLEPFTHAAASNLTQAPTPSGETLPEAVESWLLVPITAPDFSLPDLAGKARTLQALQGKPLLLSFWTSASPDCQRDLEAFEQQHRRWAAQSLQLLTLNVDDPSDPAALRQFVQQRRLSFPIVLASEDIAGLYNIVYRFLFDRRRDLTLPTSFLVNGKGDIVKIYQGPVNVEQVDQDFRQIPENPAELLAKALPFPGVIESSEFQRNYLSYGSVFFQREYFDQAKASFLIALRDDPSSAEALYGLGSVYLKEHKQSEAREAFERATKLRASYPDTLPNAWNNLGLIATQEGRTEEAVGYFQQALRLSPDHLIALDNLGNAYRQLKQWEEARKVLEHVLAVHPQDPEANYSLGMVYAQTDDNAHAYEYLQNALHFRPGYAEALNNLGVLYLRTGRRDQAVASFEECIRVAPAFDQSYLNLARVHALEGEPEKARSVLRDLLKQHPDHAQAQKALAELGP
jgi:tetratricopeptide (TPR) repeat protein